MASSRRWPGGGDFINPLVFTLICAEIYVVMGGILWVVGAFAGFGEVGEAFRSLLLGIVLAPIGGAIGLFVRAGVLHLLTLLIIKPAATGFETTFRASSYSLTPVLLAWIPIIGPVISGIWSTVLAVLGIREGHSTSTGKAAAVVLIPRPGSLRTKVHQGVASGVYAAYHVWIIDVPRGERC